MLDPVFQGGPVDPLVRCCLEMIKATIQFGDLGRTESYGGGIGSDRIPKVFDDLDALREGKLPKLVYLTHAGVLP